MIFSSYIKKIETIKEKNNNEYDMRDVLSDISRVVVDSENINNEFGKMVAPLLVASNFKIINSVIMDKEIQYISDAIGYGDVLSFKYDDKKQIYELEYQSTDKRNIVKIKSTRDKAYVQKTTFCLDGTTSKSKKTFFKDENEKMYETSSYEKRIIIEDDIATNVSETYHYNKEENKLYKKSSCITKSGNKVLSNLCINREIADENYLVSDGMFYTINKKDDIKQLLKIKEVEKKAIESYN